MSFKKNFSTFNLCILLFIIIFIFLIKYFFMIKKSDYINLYLSQILKNDIVETSNNTEKKEKISSDFYKFKINLKDLETIQKYIFEQNCDKTLSMANNTEEEEKIINKIKNQWSFFLKVKIKRDKNYIDNLDFKINNLMNKEKLIRSKIETLEDKLSKKSNDIDKNRSLLIINNLKKQYQFNQERFQNFENIKFNFVKHSNDTLDKQKDKLQKKLYSFYELE
ncbi:MAG: hypothetical protein Q8897_01245 [Sweet potato little leaf phytoplasma]|uniref:hypothetical protein n=2 Tax=Candidatus Phytoplasma australasiaticum TaxID=2754999 RepID=UPI00210D5FAC|nr:hypothetical protein [Sweet potato little leaf phytoplasma]MDV3201639.1 hypothetical protein [Candidatus Phytoplasma australasiaticum]MDO7987316.1 hypothetical protein [Sweet potato little leaf phytoplasma]MDO8008799.1 hypothetical protein [Sweet potato little leaf phytoplasma]MDO8020398.1 hypothetical protein [Sweet potato little leaf phytoplasma]MDV3139901.1 hypothetical protein [Sweet potato little leaf phytoplasma]